MRVTETLRMQAVERAQRRATNDLSRATDGASTGMRVRAPADDPTAFASLVRVRAGASAWKDRREAISSSSSELTVAESSLAEGADIMARARELAVTMADGAMSAAERTAAAGEVRTLRAALLGIANQRGASGYLFAGSAVGTAPFTAAGTFVANDDALDVEVAPGIRVRSNASGAQAFTSAGGRDVFQDLDNLANALASNNVAGVQTSVTDIEAGHTQITSARAMAGIGIDRLRASESAADQAAMMLQEEHAKTGELDAATAFSKLAEAQQAYERALSISKNILSTFDLKNMP
ncbi:MAG: hypothetical protein U0271_31800 [Polyangiaceae bacterium]